MRRAVMGIPVSHWRFRLSGEVGFTGFTLSALDLTWTLQGNFMAVSGRGRAGSFAPTNAKGALIWLPGVSKVYFLTAPKHTHRDLVVVAR